MKPERIAEDIDDLLARDAWRVKVRATADEVALNRAIGGGYVDLVGSILPRLSYCILGAPEQMEDGSLVFKLVLGKLKPDA